LHSVIAFHFPEDDMGSAYLELSGHLALSQIGNLPPLL